MKNQVVNQKELASIRNAQQKIVNKNQQGNTLVALALTIAISGVILAGILSYYQNTKNENAAQTAVANIEQMAGSISSKFASEPDYSAIDSEGSQLLIDLKAVPQQLVKGGVVRNEFGGEYTFAASDGGTGQADSYFTITTDEVPLNVCLDVASTGADKWKVIEVNGTEVDGSVVAANGACTDDDNTLALTPST